MLDLIKNRILVTGANGMLGQQTVEYYYGFPQVEVLASSIENESINDNVQYVAADITDRQQIKKIVYDFCPDFIINAAAYTNVDKCETEREQAWKLNVKGVEYLAEAARVIDAHLIHLSTDYIFDGKNGPYSEKDLPNPLGYYGRTKLASENALKISGIKYSILRTNVLYGTAKQSRPDYVKWVYKSLKENNQIRIVTDQINNPTFIDDLVQAISKIIDFRKEGIYHIGGREFISRYDFTLRIADFFELDKSLITPIKTEDLKQAARRPLKSGLVILKAQTELNYKPQSIENSLEIIKTELW